MIGDLGRLIQPALSRIKLMVSRSIIRGVEDGSKVQTMQLSLLPGEVRDRIERFQNYGFTSVPHPGMEAVVVFIGGARKNGVVVAIGDRLFRLQGLQGGEVALYTDEEDTLIFKRGRKVELTTETFIVKAATKMRVETPLFEVAAEVKARFETPLVEATGDIWDRVDEGGTTMSGMREIYDRHVHPERDVAPDNTLQPIPPDRMGGHE